MRLMTFAAGAAVGYVLGTRAGRGKYEQILDTARKLRADPSLGRAAQAVSELRSPPAAQPAVPPAPAPARTRRPRTPKPAAATTETLP
jgi:hypothetical protein